MLRTANLMSLNPETPVANHTSSEQTSPEDSSFARSLDEGAEAAWKMQSTSDKNLKNIAGAGDDLLPKNSSRIVTLVDANRKVTLRTDEKAQGGPGGIKGPNSTVNLKSINSIEGETKASRRDISSFTGGSNAAQLEAPSKKLSDVQGHPDTMKTFRRQNTFDDVGSEGLNISSETGDPEAIAAFTHNSSLTASGAVSNGLEKRENNAISNGTHNLIPPRKEKTEDKLGATSQNVRQKNKSFDVTAVSPTDTVIVPQVMLHMENYQHNAYIVTNDTQSIDNISDGIEMSAREIGASGAEINKKISPPKKQDEDNAKASDVSDDATNSQALSAGEAKNTPTTAKSSEVGNSKIKSETTLSTSPMGSIASAMVSGHSSGDAAMYTNAKSQGAVKSSDADNMHIPINTGDGEVAIDKMHKTLLATPTTLEVGVANGTHGWLKVRAEMTSEGLVNTSLSTSSSSAEEILHRELPSLSAYLQHEHVAVSTVTIQPAILPVVSFREISGGIGEESRGQAQQEQAQGGENRRGSASDTVYDARTGDSSSIESVIGGDELLMPASYTGGGGWLNIRA